MPCKPGFRDVILPITADAPPQSWILVFPACPHVLQALMFPELTQHPKTGGPPSSRNYVPTPPSSLPCSLRH